MNWFLRQVVGLPSRVLIAGVHFYQLFISPLLGKHCRFEPSCSRYFIAVVQREGAVRGTLRGVGRILRCHPWNRGGFDPP
ncbi:MAG TPA: membrane protein insertion efficiency factor YidD [Pirellulales bacterium]|jgi:putative membrane protein insertion efficiency factor|nr:membrane protein insertion efficiency factor YidD [Pirellulales bacterium]